MLFEAREIKSAADYVRVADLAIGAVYWHVVFLDAEMTVPEVTPLIFVGRDLHPEEPGLYFQDVESHAAGERFDPEDWRGNSEPAPRVVPDRPAARFDVFDNDDEFSCVYDFDGMVDAILHVVLRRNKHS